MCHVLHIQLLFVHFRGQHRTSLRFPMPSHLEQFQQLSSWVSFQFFCHTLLPQFIVCSVFRLIFLKQSWSSFQARWKRTRKYENTEGQRRESSCPRSCSNFMTTLRLEHSYHEFGLEGTWSRVKTIAFCHSYCPLSFGIFSHYPTIQQLNQ